MAKESLIIVHGPTGCGKTVGVQSYLAHHSIQCVHVDVTDAQDSKTLEDMQLRDTACKMIGGTQWALFIDDVEGVMEIEQYKTALLNRLQKNRDLSYHHAHTSAPACQALSRARESRSRVTVARAPQSSTPLYALCMLN